MKQATVTIKYEEEKLNAIQQYMEKKDANFDAELNEVMNRLWEKYVPQPVRDYIDNRDGGERPVRAERGTRAAAGRNAGSVSSRERQRVQSGEEESVESRP